MARSDSRASQRTENAYNEVWNFEEWQPYYEEQGIKIRDFAHEPSALKERPPTIFDPCNAYLKYLRSVVLYPKEVLHLYDMGWLTKEQAERCMRVNERPLLNTENRPAEHPWVPLDVEKPTGTLEEILEALRLHIQRTYPSQLASAEDTNGESVEPMAFESQRGTDNISSSDVSNRVSAPVALKRPHNTDGDRLRLRQKRQRTSNGDAPPPTLPQGGAAGSNSLSVNPYPSPLQTPSPSPAVTAAVSNASSHSIEVRPSTSAVGGQTATQGKPRGLTRTETFLRL